MSELKNLFDSLNIPEEKVQELINSGNDQPDDGPTAFKGTKYSCRNTAEDDGNRHDKPF